MKAANHCRHSVHGESYVCSRETTRKTTTWRISMGTAPHDRRGASTACQGHIHTRTGAKISTEASKQRRRAEVTKGSTLGHGGADGGAGTAVTRKAGPERWRICHHALCSKRSRCEANVGGATSGQYRWRLRVCRVSFADLLHPGGRRIRGGEAV